MERLKRFILKIEYGIKNSAIRRRTLTWLAAVVVFVTTYLLILPALTIEKQEAEKMPGMDIVASQNEVAGQEGISRTDGNTLGEDILSDEDWAGAEEFWEDGSYDAFEDDFGTAGETSGDAGKAGDSRKMIESADDWAEGGLFEEETEDLTEAETFFDDWDLMDEWELMEDSQLLTEETQPAAPLLQEAETAALPQETETSADLPQETAVIGSLFQEITEVSDAPEKVQSATEPFTGESSEVATESFTEVSSEVEAERSTAVAAETEKETLAETITEAETEEHPAEAVIETQKELFSETVTEAETELLSEAVTEAETELLSEAVTEAETELLSEVVTEAETELLTELITETPSTEMLAEEPAEPVYEDGELLFEGADYSVRLAFTAQAQIPDGAYLQVRELEPGTQEYEDCLAAAKAATGLKDEDELPAEQARFFDITILQNSEGMSAAEDKSQEAEEKELTAANRIEPKAAVSVQITCENIESQPTGEDLNVLHFAEGKEEPELLEISDVTKEEADEKALTSVAFEADSFSVYGIVGTVIEKSVLASDGNYYNISVTYGADAKLPEDVELRVTELDQDSEKFGHYLQESAEKLGKEAEAVSYARIFDISLISKNDPKIHYQPEAEVSVQIELVDANENLIKDLTVLHISEDQVDIVDTQTEGKALSFQTESFSIYPIVDGTGENARIGYRFWYFNAATGTYEQISTQYFRYKDVHSEPSADILEPGIPGISQSDFVRIFEGWFKGTVDDDSAQLQDPGMTTAELNAELHNYQEDDFVEGTVIDVVAKLKDAYYITYVDINSSNILATDLVVKEENGDTYFVVKDGVRPTKYENKLTGWRLLDEIDNSDAQLYEANHSYTIAENITLAPVIDGGYWLVYDDNDLVDDGTGKMVSGGASYTAPEFYMNSMEEQQPTRQPENPVWQGYEFGGWYSDAACTTPFEFGGLLTENTTVYAKWIPSDSAYRVIVWKQKSTDGVGLDNSEKKYDYDFSVLVDSSVKTGDLVYLDNNYTTIYGEGGTSQDTDKDYFVYNYEKTDPYIVVKADGSSVINVYYDRVPMSINFYTWGNGYVYTETTSNTGTQYGVVNGEYVPLTYIDSEEDIYTYTYAPVYSRTTGNTGTQYGIIDGDYQQLTREAVYSYTYNAYNPTTGTTGTQYALVDGEYVQLTKNSKYYPASGYSYTQADNDNDNNPQKYSVRNGSMIPVYYGRSSRWDLYSDWYRTINGNYYSNAYDYNRFSRNAAYESDSEYAGTLYYIGDGNNYNNRDFVQNGSGTPYGRRGNNNNYTYFPLREEVTWTYVRDGVTYTYDGTRYTSGGTSTAYNGTRYTRSGNGWWNYEYTATDAQSTNLYGIDSRGGHVALNRSNSTNAYRYTYNGVEYNGTRYTASNNPVTYTGQLYRNDDGVYHATDEDATNGRYGIDGNNVFRLLNGTSVKAKLWVYTDPVTGETKYYEGTRYTRSSNQQNSWQLYKSFEGLYGSTLESNGYTWPTEYNWYENGHGQGGNANTTLQYGSGATSGSRMTLKTTFEPLDGKTTANFYGNNPTTTGASIIFYKQQLDGSYVEIDRIRTGNTSGSFHINDKYTGFHAAQYRAGGSGSWNTCTPKGTDGYYGSAISYNNTFEVRFDRDEYKLTFFTNNDGNEVEEYIIPYEGDLNSYGSQSEGQKTGNYFVGWYADAGFTQPFDFNTTMPDHNVDVYGSWKMERFRVVIVPGANNVDMGSQAHTFRLNYDEKIGGSLLESATRVGYTLDGWYTDPEFTNRFLFSSPVNASTDGVDMTYQTASKWASARTDYGDDDEEHENVRGIIHLYAKWIVNTSEKGINIVYDAGEAGNYDESGTLTTEVPVDPRLYQEGSDVLAGAAPSNYSELYEFLYWVVVDAEGNEISAPIYSGTTFNIGDIEKYYSVTTDLESGEELIKTIMLRAKYRKAEDAEDRFTTITYDGNSFVDGRYPDGTEEIHGLANDGSLRKTVTLDKQINETIVLPDVNSFYLDGFTLAGWSFFEGTYEQQMAALEAYNTNPENADNQLTNFTPNQEVAADNLDQGPVNDHENTLYAMWQPKTYTVTVKQVIEDGVPVTSFTYPYKSGVENEIADASTQNLTLSENASVQFSNITTDPAVSFQYYERLGHVFKITTPTIAASENYDVRVNAIVLRDDGSREVLDINELGNYPILGDVEITYTYALKVPVTLEKRKLNGEQDLLTGARFALTPVEFNTETQRWEQIGTTVFEYDMSEAGSMMYRLQEGIYRVEEQTAPENYARMSEPVLLTVRRGEVFLLRTTAGGTVSTSIAKVTGSDGHTLVIYDRPIIPLKIKKVVDGQELETSGYTFSAQLTLEGSPMKSYDTVGQGTAADITNGAGIIEFKLGSDTSKTIYVPWGTVVEVSENEYSQFAVETSSQNNVIDEDTENARIYKCSVEQEDTITFTNKNVPLTVTKEVTGSEDDKTKPFTFTLSGLSAGKIYRFNVAGSNVTRTASGDGTVTFELKNEQSMVIPLISGSHYTVTETEDSSFNTSVIVDTGSSEDTLSKTITLDSQKTIRFTNTRKTGTLAIRKATAPAGIADGQIFKVSVANSMGQYLQDTSSISFSNTKAWFDVSVNSPLTINNLPVDTYVVAEKTTADSNEPDPAAISGYRYDNTVVSYTDADSQLIETGIVSTNATTTATITNHYTKLVDVTVRKTLEDSTVATGNREFSFTATLTEGETDISDYLGTINDNQTSFAFTLTPSTTDAAVRTFTDIPVGAVLTVTEITEPDYITTVSVGNEEAVSGSEGELTVAESDNTIIFTNTRKTTSIVIKKEDNNSHALKGAEFTLLSLDTSSPAVVSTLKIGETTQENGVISMEDVSEVTVSNLASGNYRLVETHAPNGYVILARGIDFAVDASNGTVILVKESTETVGGQTLTSYVYADADDYPDASASENTITVRNTPGVSLPSTGGPGTRLFYLLGAVLTVGAGALLWRRRKQFS